MITRPTPFTIRRESHGISGNVEGMLKVGSGAAGWFTPIGNTASDGSFAYTGVPSNYGYDRFRIYVMTYLGVGDFEKVPPSIHLREA